MDLPLGKPMGVLAYLALRREPVAREELAELFWSDAPRSNARASARQALFIVRKALDEDVFRGTDPLRLEPGAVETDVERFREALARGDVQEARRLRRAPLLQGFVLPGARSWDRWLEERSRELDDLLAEALEARALLEAEAGRSEEALPRVREALALRPHRPALHALLVEGLLARGDVPAAHEALLAAERQAGDVPGAPELLGRLGERLDAARALVHEREEEDGADRPYGFHVELVGRSRELGRLGELVASVAEGRPGAAVLAGAAGVGKTRLALEALRVAVASGFQVARVRCHRAEKGLSWGVAAELAQELLALEGAAGVSPASDRVLASLDPAAARTEGSLRHEPTAYAEALLDLVRAVAFEGPLAILVDDLQWIDEESRRVLARSFRKLADEGVLLLLTTRDVLTALDFLETRVVMVELGPLTPAEVRELVELAVAIEPPERAGEVVPRIAEAARGNPLHVGEILKRLADDGAIRSQDGGWVLEAGAVPAVLETPESVRDLILERLARLPRESRLLASVLARRHGSWKTRELRRAAGLDEATFLRAVSDLTGRGVLEWLGPDRLDFAHEHLREASARVTPPGPGLERSRRGRWARAAAAAAILLVVAGAAVMAERRPVDGAPYGQGRLLAWVGDTLRTIYPPTVPGGAWRTGAPHPLPPDVQEANKASVVPTTRGELVWLWAEHDPLLGPDLVAWSGTRGRQVILGGEGDDGPGGVSPDGRWVVGWSEDPSSSTYRRDVWVVDRTGAEEPRLLFRANGTSQVGGWSPDGRTIPVVQGGIPDTLILLSPAGRERARYTWPDAQNIQVGSWCAGGRRLTLQARRPDGSRGTFLLDLETGIRIPTDPPGADAWDPICVGDAVGVAQAMTLGGLPSLVLRDRVADTVTTLVPSGHGAVRAMAWLPDRVDPVVVDVEVRLPGGGAMPWGEARTARLVGIRTDGDTVALDAAWRSRAPSVASVTDSGLVTANHPGRSWITASWADWLADSVEVEVLGARPEEVLFHADLDRPLEEQWDIYGTPSPAVVLRDGRRALSHRGDGRYSDPLHSRETFSLDQGGTLEMEFRLPLTRPDRQRVSLCLVRESDAAGSPALAMPSESVCFQHPVGELESFHPDRAQLSFHPSSILEVAPLPPEVDPGSWTHLALQVRPDGRVQVFLDRGLWLEARGWLHGMESEDWRIMVAGAAADTELLLRDLILWRGTRYGAPDAGAEGPALGPS